MTIRISPEERAAYQKRAEAEGLSVEQWLKKLADEQVRDVESEQADIRSMTPLEFFEQLRGLELDFPRDQSRARAVDL